MSVEDGCDRVRRDNPVQHRVTDDRGEVPAVEVAGSEGLNGLLRGGDRQPGVDSPVPTAELAAVEGYGGVGGAAPAAVGELRPVRVDVAKVQQPRCAAVRHDRFGIPVQPVNRGLGGERASHAARTAVVWSTAVPASW